MLRYLRDEKKIERDWELIFRKILIGITAFDEARLFYYYEESGGEKLTDYLGIGISIFFHK